ncbi:hypothetical protein GUJ93_ZPchr0013g37142 [Zizania palustris]|uniref:Bifunctional inhibitor/plant lipid transfer protein/seed storage helical domain-containing protein n=1 Tax=Zizania palustris TaxID=103762 RepID=A0A8J5X1Y8_ZIZPA|nr:hypothetical protein GUJ93_ZPchr0013g37142 [Zizania palustris]
MSSSKSIVLLLAIVLVAAGALQQPAQAVRDVQAFKQSVDQDAAAKLALWPGLLPVPDGSYPGSWLQPRQPLIPLVPFFPLLAPPSPDVAPPAPEARPASPPAAPPAPADCMEPLTGLVPCMDYFSDLRVMTPMGACCDGFKKVVDEAPLCFCHAMNGDVMPAAVNFARVMSLPTACGVSWPQDTFAKCSTVPVPPLTRVAVPPPPQS